MLLQVTLKCMRCLSTSFGLVVSGTTKLGAAINQKVFFWVGALALSRSRSSIPPSAEHLVLEPFLLCRNRFGHAFGLVEYLSA